MATVACKNCVTATVVYKNYNKATVDFKNHVFSSLLLTKKIAKSSYYFHKQPQGHFYLQTEVVLQYLTLNFALNSKYSAVVNK